MEVSSAMITDGSNQDWAVCNCNNCSGHLEFEVSNAGTTVQCPHCGLETVLFIPAVPANPTGQGQASPPPTKPNKMRSAFPIVVIGLAVLLAAAFFYYTNFTSSGPNLRPSDLQVTNRHVEFITGAFGAKLGDIAPCAGETNKDFRVSCVFDPPEPLPHFELYQFYFTRDGRIYEISAHGSHREKDWADRRELTKLIEQLDGTLDEKYGRKSKYQKNARSAGENYLIQKFSYGNNMREVRLEHFQDGGWNSLTLTYEDFELSGIASQEASKAKAAAEKAASEAVQRSLRKGL